jgi:hypothetical protein
MSGLALKMSGWWGLPGETIRFDPARPIQTGANGLVSFETLKSEIHC